MRSIRKGRSDFYERQREDAVWFKNSARCTEEQKTCVSWLGEVVSP